MYKEEVAVRIVDRLGSVYPNRFDPQVAKGIVDEVLYDYDLRAAERALVVRNNLLDKAFLYVAAKKIDGLSDLTLKSYVLHLKHFASMMAKNVEDITAMDIRMYLAAYSKTGVKNTTLATKISVLKSFFSWLETEDYIVKSPMRKIKNVKTEKRLRKAIGVEELEMLREACQTYRQRALLEFFYTTGCRLDEVVKLNKAGIDWDRLSVKVIGKGNKERTVFISVKAKLHIQKYLMTRLDDCKALFITERRPYRRMGRRAIQREIAKIGKQAGLEQEIYPHLIRHTTATNLINNGADLVTVQKILGHGDPSTTQIYAEMSNENVEHEYRKHMIQ
jgi:integrase/recombinase XerD